MIEILMAYLDLILVIYGKNMKKYAKIYEEYFKKFHDKRFLQYFQKTERIN